MYWGSIYWGPPIRGTTIQVLREIRGNYLRPSKKGKSWDCFEMSVSLRVEKNEARSCDVAKGEGRGGVGGGLASADGGGGGGGAL